MASRTTLTPKRKEGEQTVVDQSAKRERQMKGLLEIAGDEQEKRERRMLCWEVYKDLHEQRTPEQIEQMERIKGLRDAK